MLDYRNQIDLNIDKDWYLLPSYYMHKYVLRKSLKGLNSSSPPTYDEASNLTDQQSQMSTDSGIILNKLDSISTYNTVDITLILTKYENKIGNTQPVANPCEFQQGDYIYGYAKIKNKKKYTINFSILYIIFEGFIRADGKEKKFLSMIDFDASMCGISKDEYDSSDNTFILNNNEIQPKKTYKKFFKFKMPSYTLGDKQTFLSQHLLLPPSFDAKRDLGLLSAAIKYRLCAYIISENDMEYFKVGHQFKYVQVIPHHTSQIHEYYSFSYFISQLKEEIQYYFKKKFDLLVQEIATNTTTIFKYKTHMVHVDPPLKILELKYVPPIPNNPFVNQTVSISFNMRGHELPDICSINSELVSITVESGVAIPMEITPSMFYRDLTQGTFVETLKKPTKRLTTELEKFNIKLSEFVSSGLNFITTLSVKYTFLIIDNTSYMVNRAEDELTVNLNISLRSTHIKNLDKAIVANRIGGFCLTPSFQTSHLARLYFIKLLIRIDGDSMLYLYNPVYIN